MSGVPESCDAPESCDVSVAGDVPMSLEVLEAEICRWSANLTAAEARWLSLLVEFDRRGGWRGTGCTSCAAWLAWQTSLDLRTAHEKVRVAHALAEFPALAAQMATGALTYAKVRALTRIVTVDNVDDLIAFGLAATSNQVERFVTAYRRHEPDAATAEARAHAERGLWVRNEGAVCTIRVEVPVEIGAVIVGCVDLFLHDTNLADGLRARRADAALSLVAFAAAHLGEEAQLDTAYLATVHLTPDTLNDTLNETVDDKLDDAVDDAVADRLEDDRCGVRSQPDSAHGHPSRRSSGGVCCIAPGDGLGADPVAIPVTSARRILCDAVIEGLLHHADGEVQLNRRGRRTVSKRLKRSLRLRDLGCRFPGCQHSAWVDAHHIVHWLDHGATRPENLICLCRRHHRLMHEHGWTITGDPNGQVWFHTPTGDTLPALPHTTPGDSHVVDDVGCSHDDGRCGWAGDPFDLDFTLDVICDNEWLNQQRRTTTPSPP